MGKKEKLSLRILKLRSLLPIVRLLLSIKTMRLSSLALERVFLAVGIFAWMP